ncbi:MAG: Maf family protein [Pseudomonadota bacterium]
MASRSPRRRELLTQIGVAFDLLEISVPEVPGGDETPRNYNIRVACDKARAGAKRRTDLRPVLGADTEVVLNEEVFGKPADAAAARQMLEKLAGKTHEVLSTVAVVDAAGALDYRQQISQVTFAPLSRERINAYCASGEYAGRAGAYAIQGLGSLLVEQLTGSFSGVMGLPLYETAALLRRAGVANLLGQDEGHG